MNAKTPKYQLYDELTALPHHPGPIAESWQVGAERNGYEILGRVSDRAHLLLRCNTCRGTHVSRCGVVANNKPICPHCLIDAWSTEAAAANLAFLGRDETHRHYGYYRARCGHVQRLQRGMVQRICSGRNSLRCDVCLEEREQAEAADRGWSRLGLDPNGNANYRLYRHVAGCDGVARIARANMQTGRFSCPKCGESWVTAPSNLYAMRLRLRDDTRLIKLGFSRDPASRLRYQLLSGSSATGEILRIVPMRSGRTALNIEKRLHRRVVTLRPDAVVPSEIFENEVHVGSEIYTAPTEPLILRMLDEITPTDAALSQPHISN